MLAKLAVIATAAMAACAAAAPYPPGGAGGWNNIPYSEPAGLSTRSADATSDLTSAITNGISSVGSAITSASNTVTSALSSLPNGISSSPGSSSSSTAGGSQCGQSQVLSCCSNNSDTDSATDPLALLPFIGANCIQVPVGVVPVGTFCGNQQVACCSSTQNGLINVNLGCIPVAA